MFSSADINEALSVDSWTYERLTQRVSSSDSAGERSNLFVDLLDTDIGALDIDLVLGYLEVKALVELGVFLLPPPVEWAEPAPSTRPFIPATEAAVLAALRGSGTGGADEDAAALANAMTWKAPPAEVAQHFVASKDSGAGWAELLAILESNSVSNLRRLGFVSSLPKSVWAAAGDVMFPEAAGGAAAAAAAAAASATMNSSTRNNRSNSLAQAHKKAVAAAERKKLLAKMRDKVKEREEELMQQQQQQHQSDYDGDEDEEDTDEESDLDEYELELRELRRRRDQFLKSLERDREILLQRPTLMIGAALMDDDPDMAASVMASLVDEHNTNNHTTNNAKGGRGEPETEKEKKERVKKALLDLRITPIHLRIHGFSADPSSFYANALFAERNRGGGAGDDRRALVTLATMQRRGEVASRRARLAEGTAVSMTAALDPAGGVLVDWHKSSMMLSAKAAPPSAAAVPSLAEQQQRNGNSSNYGYSPDSLSGSASLAYSGTQNFSPSPSMQHQQQSVPGANSSSPYYLSATERKSMAPLTVVSEDTELWLALKGIVFRVPWKNLTEQQQSLNGVTVGDDDDKDDPSGASADAVKDGGSARKNYGRAAEGRRLYYRSVLCPLHTGYDITTSFLTAPGRSLDLPPEEEELLDEDDHLLEELERADAAEADAASKASGGAGVESKNSSSKVSPLAQTKKAFKRQCRIHINRVYALFVHDCDVVGELVDCEQACDPHWF